MFFITNFHINFSIISLHIFEHRVVKEIFWKRLLERIFQDYDVFIVSNFSSLFSPHSDNDISMDHITLQSPNPNGTCNMFVHQRSLSRRKNVINNHKCSVNPRGIRQDQMREQSDRAG